tara:strand:+ start:2819 stop:3283 length:465 start_codon:yes stop_codon:yes gene_type:complete
MKKIKNRPDDRLTNRAILGVILFVFVASLAGGSAVSLAYFWDAPEGAPQAYILFALIGSAIYFLFVLLLGVPVFVFVLNALKKRSVPRPAADILAGAMAGVIPTLFMFFPVIWQSNSLPVFAIFIGINAGAGSLGALAYWLLAGRAITPSICRQ